MAVVVLLALPVVWRRRAPMLAFVVFAVAGSAWLDALYGAHSNLPFEPFLVLLILVYSAATHVPAARQRLVLAVLGALYLSEFVLLLAGLKGWGNVVPGLVFASIAYALGRGLQRRTAHAGALERRAQELELGRRALASKAVAEERDRIARELHDVIAHSVTVMVVQAGAGERLIDRDPEGTRQALAAIRLAGGEALDELRRLLGLLRDNPERNASAEPQPGLDRLDHLLGQVREAGLEVSCAITGLPRPLPPGIGLAAYRIVQEALTNVRKHAGGASAQITISYGRRELELTVSDSGNGTRNGSVSGGAHGLIGMSERVTLYGGTLAYGRAPSGGFVVRARLPLETVTL